MIDVEPISVNGLERYEPPELTVVGEFGEVTKDNYSRPHSDDGDAVATGQRDGDQRSGRAWRRPVVVCAA